MSFQYGNRGCAWDQPQPGARFIGLLSQGSRDAVELPGKDLTIGHCAGAGLFHGDQRVMHRDESSLQRVQDLGTDQPV